MNCALNALSDRAKAAIICALAFLIYGPGVGRGFLFDDLPYIAENTLLKQGDAFHIFWFTAKAFNYYPLFWSLLRVQWLLWGDHSLGYHLVNLAIHSVNAILVWRIAKAWRLPGAWWAGAVFAVHPINVQTVAWAAEQKNTWSFFFMAWALLAFITYAEKNNWQSYAISLLCFLAALACKTSTVCLPLFLVLCYGVRKGKPSIRRLVQLTPFFLFALAAGIATLWFEKYRVDAHSGIASLGLWQRVETAGATFWFYFGKAIAPLGLTPMYRGWSAATAAGHTAIPGALLVLSLVLCVLLWRRIGAPVALGFAYYALMLLPLLGIFDTNYFDYSLIADHWQYHALPGLILASSSAVAAITTRWPRLAAFSYQGALLSVAVLTVLASVHFARFEDARTLWTYVISRNPDAWGAWYNLGNVYSDTREYPRAIATYQRSIQLNPHYYRSRFNLANTFASANRLHEADAAYLAAREIQKADADAYNNRAVVLLRLGNETEAISEFEHALQLEPDKASSHTNLITIFLRRGQVEKAKVHLGTFLASNEPDCRRIADAITAEGRNTAVQNEALLRFATRACELTDYQHDLRSALQTLRSEQPMPK